MGRGTQPDGTQFHYLWSLPSPDKAVDFSVSGTRYLFAADPTMTFLVGGSAGMNPPGVSPPFEPQTVKTLAQWQSLTRGADAGATAAAGIDVNATVQMAAQLLQLA